MQFICQLFLDDSHPKPTGDERWPRTGNCKAGWTRYAKGCYKVFVKQGAFKNFFFIAFRRCYIWSRFQRGYWVGGRPKAVSIEGRWCRWCWPRHISEHSLPIFCYLKNAQLRTNSVDWGKVDDARFDFSLVGQITSNIHQLDAKRAKRLGIDTLIICLCWMYEVVHDSHST